MTFATFTFYAFAAILIFAALRVITTRNPVHAALWLVLSFFTAAAVWLLLRAEFLAIALVLVYVGAVMVLFLFVVMMLDVNFDTLRQHFRSYLPIGAAVGALVLFEMALVIVDSAIGRTATAACDADRQQHPRPRPVALRRLRVPVRDCRRRAAGGDRCRDRTDAPRAQGTQAPGSGSAGQGSPRRSRATRRPAVGEAAGLTSGSQ